MMQQTPARRLDVLLERDEILLLPTAYDALSARLAELAGFESLFVGGYGTAASRLGMPDIGLVSFSEMVEQMRNVASACQLPVIGDGDTGYGSIPSLVRTVHAYAQAGLAAIMIEDQVSPKRCGHLAGKQVVSRDAAIARIRAAVKARDESPYPIRILARTDARAVEGFDEALWRVRKFEELGADLLFLEAPVSDEEMETFARSCERPCLANMLEGGATPIHPPERLRDMGFSMVAYAVTLLGAAAWGVRDALANLREGRPVERMLSHRELLEVLDYQRFRDLERSVET